jgi:hypothetical protein
MSFLGCHRELEWAEEALRSRKRLLRKLRREKEAAAAPTHASQSSSLRDSFSRIDFSCPAIDVFGTDVNGIF